MSVGFDLFVHLLYFMGILIVYKPTDNIAIENCHLWLIYPLKSVIFHSCVSLPEGIYIYNHIYI